MKGKKNQIRYMKGKIFETGPEGPELEDQQVEKKSKAAQTRPKKLIRRTCPSGHGSDGSGPKLYCFLYSVYWPSNLGPLRNRKETHKKAIAGNKEKATSGSDFGKRQEDKGTATPTPQLL